MKNPTDLLRGGLIAIAAVFMFSTVVAQPVQAANILKAIACAPVHVFAAASNVALDLSVAAMNAAFNLQLKLLDVAWNVQDQAIELHRSVSEAAFQALLAVYAAITAWTTAEKAAIQKYKTNMANALTVLRTKIDATRAAYREDMLALVKAHQKALTSLVNVAVTAIKTALSEAKKNCGKIGTMTKLMVVVTANNVNLGVKGIAQEANDLIKATRLALSRNGGYFEAHKEYVSTKVQETVALMKATLGWKKETAAAQQDLDTTTVPAQ